MDGSKRRAENAIVARLRDARHPTVLLYGFLLAYVAGLLVQTGDFSNPQARIFPYLFGVPTAALLAVLVVRSVRRGDAFSDGTAATEPVVPGVTDAEFVVTDEGTGDEGAAFADANADAAGPGAAHASSAGEPDGNGELDVRTVALVSTFPFAAYLFGFAITTPAYVCALTYSLRRDAREALIVTGVVTAVWWGLFVVVLDVIFHRGVLL